MKIKVDKFEYVRLINNKMKEHEKFVDGMGVYAVPISSDNPTGYQAIGPLGVKIILSWAKKIIDQDYLFILNQEEDVNPDE